MSAFQITVIVLLLMATGLFRVVERIMFGGLMLVVLIVALIWGGSWLNSVVPAREGVRHIPYHEEYTGRSSPVLTPGAVGSDADHPVIARNMEDYARYPDGTYIKDPAAGVTILKGTRGIVRRD